MLQVPLKNETKAERAPVRFAKKSFLREIGKNWLLYAMFLPVGIWFVLFSYVPMTGIVVAFKNINYAAGIWGSKWVGLQNFKFLVSSGQLWEVTRNTILYNIAFLIAYTVFSVMLAVMISEIQSRWFKKVSQSFIFLPYFISWVVVSSFMYNMFSSDVGLVTSLVKSIGVKNFDIYGQPNAWPYLLIVLYVWKNIGYGSVLYLSAIMGFDSECYEAANIDGCNIYQRIRYVTLPMLRPTIVILILLALGGLMRGQFDMVFQLVGGNSVLMPITDNIDTLVFRAMMWSQNFGLASAGAFYQSILCLITILIANGIVRKVQNDYALF